MTRLRAQVGIVGAGPAGLLLGHLLSRSGIDSVILEARSQDYVIERVRAGVLEQGTVDLLRATGLGDRLDRDGLRHDGLFLALSGQRHRIDMAALTGGRGITIYGQNELVRDLIDARHASGRPLLFNVDGVEPADLTGSPVIRYRHEGQDHELACDFVAGCDGFHGVCRGAIPPASLRTFERIYPFAWLGILASAPPSSDELVYSHHPNGFALFSMRSPHVTRLYLQCAPDDDLSLWPDERIWSELMTRLGTADGWRPHQGDILQRGITDMRSFVIEPLRWGKLFLAGDAAHIVPPTGAKGLNLAVADVARLAAAFAEYYGSGRETLLDAYSQGALRRVWRAQRFSWWMTTLLHKLDTGNPYDDRRQLAELEYIVESAAAQTTLAENYVGLPLDECPSRKTTHDD